MEPKGAPGVTLFTHPTCVHYASLLILLLHLHLLGSPLRLPQIFVSGSASEDPNLGPEAFVLGSEISSGKEIQAQSGLVCEKRQEKK